MLEGVERDVGLQNPRMLQVTHDLQIIQHSDHLRGLLPAIKSSITFELSAALALIKDESLRNIDVTVCNHY